jgi:tetratricopeptide (TPR) repeat protein
VRLSKIHEVVYKTGGSWALFIYDDKQNELMRFLQFEAYSYYGEQVADAVYVLKEAAADEVKKDEAAFNRALQSYRNAPNKPEFTEDVRRFKVQAETAVREKRFGDAVEFYQSALNIAPWWPEGHFNSALLFGEIGDYETAVDEMKRYLQLVPDASNARAAQDKIYEWERFKSQ